MVGNNRKIIRRHYYLPYFWFRPTFPYSTLKIVYAKIVYIARKLIFGHEYNAYLSKTSHLGAVIAL